MDTAEQWRACLDRAATVPLSGQGWRVCSSLAPLATAQLVDSMDDLQLLERLLQPIEPQASATAPRLHPLLAQPWRGRPLPHGSRFGSRVSAPLFYGGLSIETALAEAAYQRRQFWQGMSLAPPSGRLIAEQTLFSFAYHCGAGLRLQSRAFQPHSDLLLTAESSAATRQLGDLLQDRAISGFEYPSACCLDYGLNIALLTPKALSAGKPGELQQWLSETTATGVIFSDRQRLLRF